MGRHAVNASGLDRARFIKAGQLLKKRTVSIADVSRQVGYGHISTFSKAFRQIAGISPSEYRKLSGR
ncbi:helix-turn-helix domain-containing protein [Thiolapillus sp.]